ncbi:uncharacterized protein LOC109706335 isoform X1 [Ananas comosus]|uniref:Uncharacterized protein LOC109706335 isoform X1 n=2 Tax=Ananas comosus TaxID=4615 RepID=A0A6P5EGX6_ANACO|nr:uncharacterized protein LOC109706335 isoform X1 [Ananas comosus]XP_020082709.1 uncharacterized protein LOC109706335 isoform X1 [Ananas comosus]
MNCISCASSAALFSNSGHGLMRRALYGISMISWRRRDIWHAGIEALNLGLIPSAVRVRCFSSKRVRASKSPKAANEKAAMAEEGDAFYVVRKGDVVAVYKNLTDCQAQVSSSVCDPSVSVYKGYSLRKETEDYLAARGLKNPLYAINAADVNEDLFGNLVPCPFQQPDGLAFLVAQTGEKTSTLKRAQHMVSMESSSALIEPAKKHLKLGYSVEQKTIFRNDVSCVLEFDGASKGNPGKSGAGVILRAEDGSVICRVREGLGAVTNNVAEYRALILGMKYALKKGFQKIRVQGDSKLVCNQVQDLWRARHENMAGLCKEAKELKDMFLSFEIRHVKREFNADADAQANLAVDLPTGEIHEESGLRFSDSGA